MRENFLHFCWRWRRFDLANLSTTDGQALEILHPGEPNPHGGPDFFNARIRLNGTLWAGNVELHVHSSAWQEHGHTHDPAYKNVILHVVYEDDQPVRRSDGERIPCLVLRGRIFRGIYDTYTRLENERLWIPCAAHLQDVPLIIVQNWCDRLLVERLEEKTRRIQEVLVGVQNDWEEAFHQLLARSYGLKINVAPFETLSRLLPWRILRKHRHDAMALEALVFGQAGLIQGDYTDEYPVQLAKEYSYLAHKYGLTPMEAGQWMFLRLRPANFPTLRLAQWAALYHSNAAPFNAILEAETVSDFYKIFSHAPNSYWDTHYMFDRLSPARSKVPGETFMQQILVNTVVPLLFLYGKDRKQPALLDRALELLEELPAEKNKIIDGWKGMGIAVDSAYQSQALLQLKGRYCDEKKCLKCAIGTSILNFNAGTDDADAGY